MWEQLGSIWDKAAGEQLWHAALSAGGTPRPSNGCDEEQAVSAHSDPTETHTAVTTSVEPYHTTTLHHRAQEKQLD